MNNFYTKIYDLYVREHVVLRRVHSINDLPVYVTDDILTPDLKPYKVRFFNRIPCVQVYDQMIDLFYAIPVASLVWMAHRGIIPENMDVYSTSKTEFDSKSLRLKSI